jgi:hypothetical protein
MLAIVRAVEFLFAESAALKTVLLSHRIPTATWGPQVRRLLADKEISAHLHAKFQHLYDEIERARDESKAFEELLKVLPTPNKQWN